MAQFAGILAAVVLVALGKPNIFINIPSKPGNDHQRDVS